MMRVSKRRFTLPVFEMRYGTVTVLEEEEEERDELIQDEQDEEEEEEEQEEEEGMERSVWGMGGAPSGRGIWGHRSSSMRSPCVFSPTNHAGSRGTCRVGTCFLPVE